MLRVDLNCDLGEGAGNDAELMPFITSANIACGAHAGDDATMRATIELALQYGVAIGAHPGFADRQNFGRREMKLDAPAARELISGQIRRCRKIAAEYSAQVAHVKLHGALYNLASRDAELAKTIIEVMDEEGKGAALFVLSGSELERQARRQRTFPVVAEVFADRSYQADGTLTPRNQAGAVRENEDDVVAQALRMVTAGKVRATDGADVTIKAETICLHGDGVRAVSFARRLNAEFKAAGITLERFKQDGGRSSRRDPA